MKRYKLKTYRIKNREIRSILNVSVMKKEYIENKMSICEIRKKYNIGVELIYKLLDEYNIHVRNSSEAQHYHYDKKEEGWKKDIIVNNKLVNYMDGLLISDGYAGKMLDGRNCSYVQSCKYKEWLEYISKFLLEYNINSRIGYNEKGDIYYLYCFSHPMWNIFHSRWYNNRVKILPGDIDLNPQVLANWYMGDGSIGRSYKYINAVPCIIFACRKFNYEDKKWLLNELNRKYNYTGRIDYDGIYLHSGYTWNFVKMIAPYIVPCYHYKTFWRVNQRELEKL